MANPEHSAKLKEGVEAWNKWRIAHCKRKSIDNVIPHLIIQSINCGFLSTIKTI
jgi:hypothetical protein